MAQAIGERRAEHDLPTACIVFDSASHNIVGNGCDDKPGFQISEEDQSAQTILWPASLEFFQ